MDRIDLFRVYLRIAECGSFSHAADQLGLPRATVSMAVQQLETLLGARLFHRTTRRVSLTQDGEAIQDRVGALVADMEDIEQRFRPSGGAIAGRLRVDLPSRIARRIVAPALPDFLARHPKIEIDLGSSDRSIDLVQENVDCAVRVGGLTSSSLVARPLGKFELINCASPAYLAEHGTPGSPDDLGNHLSVDYLPRSTGRRAPWEWVEGPQIRTLHMSSRVSADNAETYIACALAGLGLIQIPRFDVAHHLNSGCLIDVLPEARAPAMPVHLVYPHRKHLSRRVQAFFAWFDGLIHPHTHEATK
jgi:DNA-binding transcriptional LysR family regulator